MVRLIVKFMGIARLHAGTYQVDFESSNDTLRQVLREISETYQLGDTIRTETGDVRSYARVLINGRSFQFAGGLDAELHEGDALALIYPWLGHEDF